MTPPRPPEGKHSPHSEWCCSCLDDVNAKLVEALEELFEAYCSAMSSEYDFPNNPWTPDRDKDEVAIKVQALLREAAK